MALAAACDSTKPIGLRLLFQQVRHEAGGAREYGHALERAQREPGIEQHGGNGGRHVHYQCLAGEARQQRFDLLRGLAMRVRQAGLGGHREQARGARVLALVQRMTVAGDGLACRAQFGDDGLGGQLQV